MEIKIRTPFYASQSHSGADLSLETQKQVQEFKAGHIGSGSMNIIRNLARSVSGNGSRDVGPEEGLGQGQHNAAPKAVIGANSQTQEEVGSYGQRSSSRSQDMTASESKGSNSVEDDFKEGAERGKLYSPADGVDSPNAKQAESASNQMGSQKFFSKPFSQGRESQNGELQGDSDSNVRRNGTGEVAQGWGMGKNVLEVSKGVAADIRGSLFHMKDMLIDKLAAVPIPAESLDNARHSIESIIREATQTAYGMTKDAMLRIRLRLVEILPSLTPNETREIVDDVEREVLDMSEAANGDSSSEAVENQVKHSSRGVSASTASAVSSNPPEAASSTSVLSMNMNRIKSWSLLRSRL